MNHHIIYKQQATIRVDKEEQAYAVQNMIGDVLKNELSQQLETVFDELTPDGEIIRIDSLQLDLGTLPMHNIKQAFAEQLIEEIKKAIVEKKEKWRSEKGTVLIQKEQSLREALMCFLQTGLKPWFNTIKSRKEWENEMQQGFARDDWQKVSSWLRENCRQQPHMIERVVNQFSDDFLKKILDTIILFTADEWKALYVDLQTVFIFPNNFNKREARTTIWITIFSSFLRHPHWEDAIGSIVKEVFALSNADVASRLRWWEESIAHKLQTVWIREAVQRVINETENKKSINNAAVTNKDEAGEDKVTTDENDKIKSSDNGVKEKLGEYQIEVAKKRSHRNSAENMIGEAPQYVINSGIVLLHPFLELYFKEAALLENRKFKNNEDCQRAVLLLHYLATGDTEGAEYDMLLQKIVCGLSVEETLPGGIELTDKEREEANNLLQSVINYWPPLKNTSVEGLRSTFLQREGKLEAKENGWLLTVEQKTVDVLLDKLPWGFSTVKLPWMKAVLNVDWC